MTNILDYDETKHWLNYITESPDREHGGFHGITIDTARSALFYMDKFETELAALRERTRWISAAHKLSYKMVQSLQRRYRWKF